MASSANSAHVLIRMLCICTTTLPILERVHDGITIPAIMYVNIPTLKKSAPNIIPCHLQSTNNVFFHLIQKRPKMAQLVPPGIRKASPLKRTLDSHTHWEVVGTP